MKRTTFGPAWLLALLLPLYFSGCADLAQTDPPPTATAALPFDGSVVRHFDGVPFTTEESAAVLTYVNAATLTELDEHVGLDIRAARSIVKAQPINSMQHLSNLFFVGGVTLTKLKDAAHLPLAVAQAETLANQPPSRYRHQG